MSEAPDGRRVNRPYRKASEYLTTKQGVHSGPRTINALEHENAELREKLTTSVRRMETMEVEFEQSREYFANQLDITNDKLIRTAQALKVMQQSYHELQTFNYELEQRISKISELEHERSQLTTDVHELTNKLTEARSSLQKIQKENERLRKDCSLAVSLLECNAGNFKQQRANELPHDLQNRVEEYQIDLSQYNEYINPYADESDSDEEQQRSNAPSRQQRQTGDAIPTELLANVLKKPENVHMSLEDTDYIRDPDLNSMYKGRIAERKLVKHDYGTDSFKHDYGSESSLRYYGNDGTAPRTLNQNLVGMEKSSSAGGQSSSGSQSSSPWELAQTVTSSESSSPWEMSANPPSRNDYDADDYSAASAYGAYPVSYRSQRSRKKQPPAWNVAPQKGIPVKKSAYGKSRMTSSYNAATFPTVRKSKGTGENEDVYISESFKQQLGGETLGEQGLKSGQSSRKSSPTKLPVDIEKGSSAEKSSLLDQEGSDDMLMTIELESKGMPKLKMRSPIHDYRGQRSEFEGHGLLHDSDPEPDERDLDHKDETEVNRESEESDASESSMREEEKSSENKIPEFDLMNLNENVKIATKPLHHLLLEQSLLSDEAIQSSLLPDLPPQYDEELILCEVPAPPPPDMFGGGLLSQTPPMPHPLITSQPNHVISDAGQTSMTSQVSSSNSLDDLEMMVKKELIAAQSPTKKPTPSLVENITQTPSSVQKQVTNTEHGFDCGRSHTFTCQEYRNGPEDNSLDETRAGTANDQVLLDESKSSEARTDTVIQPLQEAVTQGVDGEIIQNSSENIDTLPQDGSQEFDSNDSNLVIEDSPTENAHSEIQEKENLSVETLENMKKTAGRPETLKPELLEGQELVVGAVQSGSNLSDILNNDSEATSDENYVSEGSYRTSEPNTAQLSDNKVMLTSLPTEPPNEETIEPPLEVIELQEEPRGGNYGRRRRNSFEQAREYGNVMGDGWGH